MNNENSARKVMFGRVDVFLEELQQEQTPALSLTPAGVVLHTALGVVISDLETFSAEQVSGRGEVGAGSVSRQQTAEALKKVVRGVNRVAKRLDPLVHPGVASKFAIPRDGLSFERLLALARSFMTEIGPVGTPTVPATPLRTVFADHLGEAYLGRLSTLIAQFDVNTDRKSLGRGEQVASTASLKTVSSRGLAIVKQLDAIVTELLETQPGKLAAWKSLSRVERRTVAATTPPVVPGAPAAS